MKLNRKLFSLLLVICMTFTCAFPVSAATLEANYGEASYYDIAVTNYSRMLLFQNGVVVAANANKQYGLIDATGKTVVPFQYAGMWYLGGDLYKVSDSVDSWDGNQGIINSKGKVILPLGKQSIHARDGIISVMDYETYSSKYYTTDWKQVNEAATYNPGSDSPIPGYDYAYRSNGYYIANKGDQTAALDANGNVIIPLQSKWISTVKDGNTVAFVVGNALLDANGKTIVPEGTYDSLDAGWKGMVNVSSGDKRGLIDLQGNVLVPLGNYKDIGGVNMQGYVSAVTYDGWDKTSNVVSTIFKDGKQVKTISGKYVASEAYYRDFAFTTGGELNGMMTLDGKVTLPEKYYAINPDGNGNLLTATIDESWHSTYGLYSQDGKQIFAEKYSQISYLKDNKYRMCDGTYYGVMNIAGTEIIPLRNLDMRIHTYSFIELYDGTYHSVVDLSNKTIVPQSTEQIQLFQSVAGLDYALERSMYLSASEDGYTQSVMPFCIKTANGSYATIYADYNTGEVKGDLAVRASNINADGQFAYQAANGLFGLATLKNQTPAKPANPFTDVAEGKYFYTPVLWAVENNITAGRTATTFAPNDLCSVGNILTFLWRAYGKPTATIENPFTDVTEKNYYYGAALWAVEQGIIEAGTTFGANANCTRAMAVTYMWKAAGSPSAAPAAFTDVAADSASAPAVAWALEKGVTTGYDGGTFRPDNTCTRGNIVTFLWRGLVE